MSTEYQNIILRMPNWLGDAVMATPLIYDVRKKWPRATLTVMCQSNVSSLLLGNPHIDEIFSFSRPNEFQRREKRRNIMHRLRQGNYDLGILLTNSFSSAWWFLRGGVKKRIGFADHFRSALLSSAVAFPKQREKQHLITTYKHLLEPLDIPLSSTQPALYVMEKERKNVEALFQELGIPSNATLIGINPGAAYGSAKCWLPDRFRAVSEKLLQDPTCYLLFFGDNRSASLVHEICLNLPKRAINLAAKTTLRELIALIERCSVFLTNDSGPMHIASALKRPLVALFGSTSAIKTGPYNRENVIHKQVSCSPCYRRSCPIDFKCMKQIGVEEVYKALLQELVR